VRTFGRYEIYSTGPSDSERIELESSIHMTTLIIDTGVHQMWRSLDGITRHLRDRHCHRFVNAAGDVLPDVPSTPYGSPLGYRTRKDVIDGGMKGLDLIPDGDYEAAVASDGAGLSGTTTSAGHPSTDFEHHNIFPTTYIQQVNSVICEGVSIWYPELTVAAAEGDIAWVPHQMWRTDKNYKTCRKQVS
jgi:hypothetical protein